MLSSQSVNSSFLQKDRFEANFLLPNLSQFSFLQTRICVELKVKSQFTFWSSGHQPVSFGPVVGWSEL